MRRWLEARGKGNPTPRQTIGVCQRRARAIVEPDILAQHGPGGIVGFGEEMAEPVEDEVRYRGARRLLRPLVEAVIDIAAHARTVEAGGLHPAVVVIGEGVIGSRRALVAGDLAGSEIAECSHGAAGGAG
jgi:hypothetical protein